MGDYKHSQEVDAPAGRLFDYLCDVRNLPRYFSAMTSAEPAGGDAVRVVADLGGTHPGGRGMVPCRPGATTPGMGVGGPE